MIEHLSVVRLVRGQDYMTLDADTVFLQAANIAFDAATLEVWGPLLNGGRCVVYPARPLDIETLNGTIKTRGVTAAWLSAGLFEQWSHDCADLPTLEYLLCGGDVINPAAVQRVHQQLGDVTVINGYGPTENTTFSRCFAIERSVEPGLSVPIGFGLKGDFGVVLSEQGRLLPEGVVGELWVGGDGLSRGYLNNPQMTRERFVNNPYYHEGLPGACRRLYRTGDRVSYLPNGALNFVGRQDEQVKIRGFRIELGEIEQQLNQLDSVAAACVLALGKDAGSKSLVAYVQFNQRCDGDGAGDIEQVKAQLAEVLPNYLLPQAYVVMAQWPLTPNGKVDKKALPAPDRDLSVSDYVAAQTQTEQLLVDVWGKVLDLPAEKISVNANFFALGGHSLLVVRLISELQKAGCKIAAKQLYEAGDLAELAQLIDANGAGEQQPAFKAPDNLIPDNCEQLTPQMLPLVELSQTTLDDIAGQVPGGAANIQDIYPLGPLQQGILFHHMLDMERDAYVLSSLYEVSSKQAMMDLLAMLQFIVDRHDVLRTAVFWQGHKQPVQVVLRQAQLPVKWTPLADEAQLQAFVDNYRHIGSQRMDLHQAPLLQLEVAHHHDEHYAVLLKFHHIISDHVGLEIILKELAYYQAGQADKLPKPVPYREFIAFTQHQTQQHDADGFFKAMLADVSEPTAPFDLTDIQGDGSEIEALRVAVPDDVSRDLRRVAAKRNVSPAVLFHTAWSLVVAACSGRDDVVFGTVLSGRLQGIEGAEHMMGVFINTLPIRVKLSGDISAVVDEVESALRALLPFEQSSLAQVQRCSSLAADVPLFSAVLNYRHSAPVEFDFDAESDDIKMVASEERANYPFDLSVDDLGEGFELDVQVHQSVGAGRIAQYVQTALTGMVQALLAEQPLPASQVPVLPEAEQQQLLVEWNDNAQAYPQDQCIHQRFEAQVLERPDAVALVFEDSQMCFAELDAAANRLAHYLIANCSVGPDVLVGLCMERSAEMVIAVLAILKAGGAYVPIAPENPEARIDQLIEDAGLTVMVSHKAVTDKTKLNTPKVICVDDAAMVDALATQLDSKPVVAGLTPENLAYVIYTSGSTGKPKGVMVAHKGVVNLINVWREDFAIGEQDRILLFAPISFDMSVEELFAAIGNGAGVVVRTDEWLAGSPSLQSPLRAGQSDCGQFADGVLA